MQILNPSSISTSFARSLLFPFCPSVGAFCRPFFPKLAFEGCGRSPARRSHGLPERGDRARAAPWEVRLPRASKSCGARSSEAKVRRWLLRGHEPDSLGDFGSGHQRAQRTEQTALTR